MAGSEEGGGAPASDCRFEWDEESKLYFHAGSGFYHDPNAGWYYSSRNGLYYTFENGSYVLLTCNKDEESNADQCMSYICSEPIQDRPFGTEEEVTLDGAEDQCPPSGWLEETLINLYLSGYSKTEVNADSSLSTVQTDDKLLELHHGIASHEGECIPKVVQDAQESSDQLSEEEDTLSNEKKWQAQYGQVVRSQDEGLPSFPVVDLWDWEMVVENARKRHQVARMIGRLVRRSNKLHPSVPAGGGLLKTAAIHDVHLDLVRVASGKVYRLRSPSTRYLGSLLTYDASNPTKDWGFPDLYINIHGITPIDSNQTCGSEISDAVISDNSSATLDQSSLGKLHQSNVTYRDRAAERRILHGGFSIAPGQKSLVDDLDAPTSSSESFDTEVAAAEAMNMSFGRGSYARRIIESMGWKDGEALGSTNKGILEPLQVVGNKGQAGLGWNHISRGI